MPEMLHHAKAVRRAVKNSLLMVDMPYESYQIHPEECVKNAQRFINEAGAEAVKLEWFENCPQVTEKIIQAGIPVMGHIGLTPQTADKIGGFKVQGKDAEAARQLIAQAIELEKLGCFAIVLECVPDKISALISNKLKIPTIGIGAGIHCDGQVLVINDMLGLFDRYTPKFVKKYANLSPLILEAVQNFKNEVIQGKFPQPQHSFTIKEEELKKINGR
jgi:3-methyl-2-oxobutanoate hydroxymethyltransferase